MLEARAHGSTSRCLARRAIAVTLAKGLRTADIKLEGTKVVSISEMGDAILAELETLAA